MDGVKRERLKGIVQSYAIAFAFSGLFSFAFGRRFSAGVGPWLMTVIFAVPFATFLLLARQFVLPRLRHRSFLVSVLGNAFALLGVIALSFAASLALYFSISQRASLFDPLPYRLVAHVFGERPFQAAIGLALVLMVMISAFYKVQQLLGKGVLWNWVTGKYHEPTEEERVFMFLDLKDSTTLAERMGTLKFSALVRDFFQDLSSPVLKTYGQVSHYIGDEAVLTWTMGQGFKEGACVRCFFLMEEAVRSRRDLYLLRYGMVPGFKASIHCGPVVATQVGEVKSEIVFHGDTLNTAARIQGMCSALGADLLISGEVSSRLGPEFARRLEPKGEHLLKGKEHAVAIFAVHREAPEPSAVEVEALGHRAEL